MSVEHYYHPRQGRMHAGHKRRIEIYLRGGLRQNEIARLTGVLPATISRLAEDLGLRASSPWRPNTTSAHGCG